MLKEIEFDINLSSSFCFLELIGRRFGVEDYVFLFARYFLDHTLVNIASLKYLPSLLAAGTLFLAEKLLKGGDWPKGREDFSGISEEEVKKCAKDVVSIVARAERGGL